MKHTSSQHARSPRPTAHGASQVFAGWGLARALALGAMWVCAMGPGLAGCDRRSMPLLDSDILPPWGSEGSSSASRPAPSRTGSRTPTGDVGDLPLRSLPGISNEPEMRVRVREAVTTSRISVTGNSDTQVWVRPVDGSLPATSLRAPLQLGIDGQQWLISDAAGAMLRYPRTTEVDLAPDATMLEGASSVAAGGNSGAGSGNLARKAATSGLVPVLAVDGVSYPGRMRLISRSDAGPRSFDVIEHVGMEEYLKGVVASEMWPDWPLTAFKVQAVAARSYAIQQRNLSRRQSSSFDVESSVKDQAYNGATRNQTAVRAVEATRGVVLTWNGEILRAYYSSTSGGRPGSAKDTWPITPGNEFNLAGPLQAEGRDESMSSTSPFYRWSVTRSRGELLARLKRWGQINGHPVRGLQSLGLIAVATRNPAGRPSSFTVRAEGASGQVFTMSAEQLRFASNQETTGQPTVTRQTRVNSGDFEPNLAGDVYTFTGRGFGHGVGMCQWSVKELADRKQDWRDITLLFYPGAKLERAY
jgi:stage II sporulation protein D